MSLLNIPGFLNPPVLRTEGKTAERVVGEPQNTRHRETYTEVLTKVCTAVCVHRFHQGGDGDITQAWTLKMGIKLRQADR